MSSTSAGFLAACLPFVRLAMYALALSACFLTARFQSPEL